MIPSEAPAQRAGAWTLTVIMPVFNEAAQISANVQEVHSILEAAGVDHNFVLVDDGSRDSTWLRLQEMARSPVPVLAVRLSRNFGKEAALSAGLKKADGDAVVTMDADLQHPPRIILEMIDLWREGGFDVVEGVKIDRGRQSWTHKALAGTFYSGFSALTGLSLKQATDFKLLDRRVVDVLTGLNEKSTFYRGLTTWVGFTHATLPFAVEERTEGASRWSLRHLLRYAVDSTVSFTTVPLYLVSYAGAAFFVIGVLLGIQTLWVKISGSAVDGFTTVIILLLGIGGMIMVNLGVIGLYLSRIYDEAKARPQFVVGETAQTALPGEVGLEHTT